MADFLNVIVINEFVQNTDEEFLFGPHKHTEECMGCIFCQPQDVIWAEPKQTDMFDLLVRLGAFKSKSQARKNWQHGKDIPNGWSEFFVGKKKRHLSIWNPTE